MGRKAGPCCSGAATCGTRTPDQGEGVPEQGCMLGMFTWMANLPQVTHSVHTCSWWSLAGMYTLVEEHFQLSKI